jgi:DDE superfamily endonuclease
MDATQRRKIALVIGLYVFVLVATFKMLMPVPRSSVLPFPPPPDVEPLTPPWMNGVFMDVNMMSRKRKRQTGPWYIFPRGNCWFDKFVKGHWGPSKWRQHFRMSRENFDVLCDTLAPSLQREATNFKHPITIAKQVAVTLLHLAKNTTYDTLSELMGLGVSTIHYCIKDVVNAIVAHPDLAIRYPEGDALARVIKGFKDKHGFPNCVGAIDGTLLKCVRPKGVEGADYFDRKKSFSTALQAIVGPDCKFLDVYVGWPGAVHDARILWNSPIREAFEEKTHGVFLVPSVDLYGCDIRPWLVADGGYGCQPWLITPFDDDSTRAKRHWNYCHSSTRMVVERTFGIFKGIWRIFHAINGVCRHKPKMVIKITHACTRLHNWLIDIGEIEVADLPLLDEDDYVGNFDNYVDEQLEATATGMEIREHLFQFICHRDGYDPDE